MKFTHLSDCHIGSWREPKLRNASTHAFLQACDFTIKNKCDFMLISGDLFNTASPGIDYIKEATTGLKKLLDAHIPVYIIAGSHDFSPSGKTMIDVLSRAGLVHNVAKGEVDTQGRLVLRYTTDPKTGVKICGIIGRKGMLDTHYYNSLALEPLEAEPGEKIFLFHTLLTEFKPSEFELMESVPLSSFPKGFNYYAGGHPHFVEHRSLNNYGIVAYPGPLFPNNFREIEKLRSGGFYYIEDWKPTWIKIEMHPVVCLTFTVDGLHPQACDTKLIEALPQQLQNTIITIRIEGVLSQGKPTDISRDKIQETITNRGGLCCLWNTAKLYAKEYIAIKKQNADEETLIAEHAAQNPSPYSASIQEIMHIMNQEKKEGERIIDFEERIITDADKYFA